MITLDAALHGHVFPKLWTIAESLTGCGQDGRVNHIRLVSRAANASAAPAFRKRMLEHLRLARNAMTHEMKDNTCSTSTYQLLRVIHELLIYHLRTCGMFRSREESFHYLDLPTDRQKLRRDIQLRKLALRAIANDGDET